MRTWSRGSNRNRTCRLKFRGNLSRRDVSVGYGRQCEMNVICFGGSNTCGCAPRSWLGGRYDADGRWVDILAAETGWTVPNKGVNGREVPERPPAFRLARLCGLLCWAARVCFRAAARRRPPGSWSVFSWRSAALPPDPAANVTPKMSAHRRRPDVRRSWRLCPGRWQGIGGPKHE